MLGRFSFIGFDGVPEIRPSIRKLSIDINPVNGSISTKSTSAPQYKPQLEDATKLIELVHK